MKRKKTILFISLFTALGVFSSCNNEDTITSESSSSNSENSITQEVFENHYYNQNNFIESSKLITNSKVKIYEGPSFLHSMEGISVKVNNESLFVYETRVNHRREFSWEVPSDKDGVVIFDFEGKVHIDITLENEEIKNAYISPLVYGIKPTLENKTISFDLEYADNYVFQYTNQDGIEKALHIFASPIESDPISEEEAKNDNSIIYIGPGVYKADAIPVASHSTIYIAGGAYVYGQIRAEGLEDITIKGRGIISGSIYSRSSESEYTIPIEIRSSNNVTIEDLTFLDPAGWTIALYKSKNVTLNNVKIITARQNGDGISVQSCENVNVNKGFVRTWDDSLVVKNVDRGVTKSVHFDGVSVWTDLAQSMEVGYETYGATMDDIEFKNITVFHNYHKAAISLHNSDDANISNVKYQNITIEDASMLGDNQSDGENDFFIDFTIAYSIEWTKSQGNRGSVSNVTIDNVKVYQMEDTIVSRMNGESATSKIQNVNISNIEIEGNKINSKEDLKILENQYVENVTYQNNSDVLGAKISLPYKLNLASSEVSIDKVKNVTQEGMLVPDFARAKGDLPYIGVKANITPSSINATHGAGTKNTTPADDGSGDFSATNFLASSSVDNNLETSWRSKEWKNEENEFASLTIEFDQLTTVGVIRILGNQDNEFYYNYNIQLWGRKEKSDGSLNSNYTRIAGTKEYAMSPSNGNAIDINLSATKYIGIQLRLYKDTSPLGAPYYEISEIEFYPPSLSFNKSIVDSTEHNDVYTVEKIVDGDATGTSYYESKSLPATIVIDLGAIYEVNTFVMSLPPSLMWDARSEEIEILSSDSNVNYSSSTTFESVVAKKSYLFDPATGNRNIINITPKRMRFVKIVITSNDVKGGYNAQLSEFSVYGVQ